LCRFHETSDKLAEKVGEISGGRRRFVRRVPKSNSPRKGTTLFDQKTGRGDLVGSGTPNLRGAQDRGRQKGKEGVRETSKK